MKGKQSLNHFRTVTTINSHFRIERNYGGSYDLLRVMGEGCERGRGREEGRRVVEDGWGRYGERIEHTGEITFSFLAEWK